MKKVVNSIKSKWLLALINFFILTIGCSITHADEGGVGFWVPGYFGTLAAAPLQPGLSLASIYYNSTVNAGENVAFARQVTLKNIQSQFTGNLDVQLDAEANLFFAIPSYTFKKNLLNGQATLAMAIPYGRSKAGVNATVSGNLGLGSGFTLGSALSEQIIAFGDLAPLFSLRWNKEANNFMFYLGGSLPVGAYNAKRLANLGTNHNSIDSGLGYTYFNYEKGHEFSSVIGWTYNFENKQTLYQNGVDMHWDLSASKFLANKTQLGAVGYAYQQLSCDKGTRNFVGCFKSRVFGAGPQIGYITSIDQAQVFINLKGYKEFEAKNRASGWNAWLTVSLSPLSKPEK